MLVNRWIAPLALAACAVAWLQIAPLSGQNEEALWRHRNLGKAFYENPTTGPQAVEEFRKALDLAPHSFRERLNYGLALLKAGSTQEGVAELQTAQKQDPKIPHTWFNLGVANKKLGNYSEAIRQFQGMIQRVPDEPVSRFNLGLLFNLSGKEDLALKEFEAAHRIDPNLVAPIFQIYNVHRLAGREREAAEALARFQKAKELQKQWDESEDMEWSFYSEIYDPVETRSPAAEAPPLRAAFSDRKLEGTWDAASAQMAVFTLDGDARPDLLAWSRAGARTYRGGTEAVDAGLGQLKDIVFIAPGDFNNDGLDDLCVLTASAGSLYVNRAGKYEQAAAPGLPAAAKAVWLDYDHDTDLDLFLLGAASRLFRNQGEKGFHDRTADFPFAPGRALDGIPFRLIADGKGFDLLVSYAGRTGVLYRDQMRGRYRAVPLEALPAGARGLAVSDINSDGWMDAAFATAKQAGALLNRESKWEVRPVAAAGAAELVLADLENRGASDLIAGNTLFRNFTRVGTVAGLNQALAAADFDLDGRIDLAGAGADGSIRLLRNTTASENRWIRVSLQGVKTLRQAPGAEIEIKAGPLYQKQPYTGLPLLFGLRNSTQADAVRVTWPNGLIQNETAQAAGTTLTMKEAPRLSGSCPMIYTWDGTRFRFLTDVLGVAPLGASSGDGSYFPVDHDEYVQIPGEVLRPLDGQYEIRITEELREVSYLDQVRLIALDHPAGMAIVTNDKFKAPPFPGFRLFGVRERVYPERATDDRGRDVRERLLRRDRAYVDGFPRDYSGVAEMHHLTLDFPSLQGDRAVLVMNGWVDWADGSAFLRASQERELVLPYLQVKDAAGRWRTVIEDLGLPAGKPKTIAVDLTGKFLSASREVRIATSLCLYWDEIFLSEDTAAPPARLTAMDPATAGLRFRGFSRPLADAERKQPEAFDYAQVSPVSLWNPAPGLYTRYGSVRELTRAVDDRYVIMGSGDELRLRFDPASLPPLPPGWKRDFLLLVDGWSKDGDANTAFSQTVEPLPFHGMSGYPYPDRERYPQSAAHRAYREQYNTRPALRLIRPLHAQPESPWAYARHRR